MYTKIGARFLPPQVNDVLCKCVMDLLSAGHLIYYRILIPNDGLVAFSDSQMETEEIPGYSYSYGR